jgi:glycolate oxidase
MAKTALSIEQQETLFREFTNLLGETRVIHTETEEYGADATEDLCFPPQFVVLPETTAEVAGIVKLCSKYNVPLTTRGAGTGLSGGALPVFGGIVLSTRRMNQILNIDTDNLQIKVQPGVITQVLQEAVEEHGLYYAPDPSSRGSCFIGGNLAENAGGPRAVKYGVTKDWVLDLEVVLASGEIIRTGASVLKNATGYNLTQLMIGSEGTLGIITEAVLKLIPKPACKRAFLVNFKSAEQACEAVSAIFRAGITPSALEFMDRDAIVYTLQVKNEQNYPLPDYAQAQLLIELDGANTAELDEQMDRLGMVLEQFNCDEISVAESKAEQDAIWRIRRAIGEAVKSHSIYKEEDTVVPRYYLPQLLNKVKSLEIEYGFNAVCYGHAGDGNLHVNIMKGNLSDTEWNERLPQGIRKLFEEVKRLGGTLSGEHGIGWVQKSYMDIIFPEHHLELMRGIKKLFDPQDILNPGKILP